MARVARELLGKLLIRYWHSGTLLVGRMVETDVYDGATDEASHSHRGRTKRLPLCQSCSGVVDQFKQLFPDLTVIVKSGPPRLP